METSEQRRQLPYVPVKHPYKSVRWAFMKWADITDALDQQRVYLRRLRIVQTPWGAVYLHWIYLPDDDRDPHDHPCNFWSLVVRGGYTEKVYDKVRVSVDFRSKYKTWGRLSLHKMPIEWAHRITHLKPGTVTLVFFGRRQQDWGFYTANGYVPWREYERATPSAEEADQPCTA